MTKGSSIVLPGLNVQAPWADLLVSGLKAIETRHYAFPEKYLGRPIAIIETATRQKPAPIIGIVIFDRSSVYRTRADWAADSKRHLVETDDQNFFYDPKRPKHAWRVKHAWKLKTTISGPAKKGIVFASSCELPFALLPLGFKKFLASCGFGC